MRRRLLPVVVALATILAYTVPVGAAQDDATLASPKQVEEGRFDSYIVVMKADPLVADFDPEDLDSPPAKNRGQEMKESHTEVLEDAGVAADEKVYDYVNTLNGFSALLSYKEALRVAADPGVAFVFPDELRQIQTDSSPDFLGLTGPAGPWSTGYTGENVIVGVIDTGIWPEHPSFADDGSYSDLGLDLPCEFGNTAQNPDDAPFECNNKLLGARQMLETYRAIIGADPDEFDSARDDNGHGTHTASTAAGNGDVDAFILGQPVGVALDADEDGDGDDNGDEDRDDNDRDGGTISGIAPRARIIAYKGLGNLGGFTSDLAAAIDQAVLDGVDVINYSIGGGAGLAGADDIAFLFAADAGVFVATSAGNSGPGPDTVGSPANAPWLTSVGASTQPRFLQGTVRLGNGASYPGASVTPGVDEAPLVDAADYGNELCDPAVPFTGDISGTIVLCLRGATARVAKSLAVANAGGVGMVMYNTVDTDNLFTDTHWVPSVHVDNTPGLEIKSYIAAHPAPTASITTGEIGTWESAPSMTIFSSRGPNGPAPDIIKPDITAPGLQILAGYSPFSDPGTTPPGELFAAIAGTSMSSPHVAGVFALIKQAHPDWSPAAAKSAIMTTARHDVVDNDRTSPADPFDMGSGHLDPGNKVDKGSAFQPGLVYEAGFLDYLGFLCGAAPEVFGDPAATCGSLESIGVHTDPSDLNYPSIGVADLAGSQTVTRTVTSVAKEGGWRTYTVEVDEPHGYSVSVSPSTIKLKRGQSATYQVTMVNESAPIGEWRFGSLTWEEKTGKYEVYSPIAVKAALFDAPDTVTGTGESGSTSFQVKFGYTGSYAAAAHGLAPATITSATVVQDPDQDFDPGDGFSNAHTFNLSGEALFRVALPPEATEPDADLDVYVFDPGGNLVAASTRGGTDELVDISNPADGTWTVYVHGWSTPGGDSDYDLYSWQISATPGGNLVVDNAPSSATLGTTGTIDVSWTGASLGQWHLGAVSHTGDSGLMGLTLVEVDNR